jgi:hypothetical protein
MHWMALATPAGNALQMMSVGKIASRRDCCEHRVSMQKSSACGNTLPRLRLCEATLLNLAHWMPIGKAEESYCKWLVPTILLGKSGP